jgi:hypothetical protein
MPALAELGSYATQFTFNVPWTTTLYFQWKTFNVLWTRATKAILSLVLSIIEPVIPVGTDLDGTAISQSSPNLYLHCVHSTT